MKKLKPNSIIPLAFTSSFIFGFSPTASGAETIEQCLLRFVTQGDESLTLGEIREQCAAINAANSDMGTALSSESDMKTAPSSDPTREYATSDEPEPIPFEGRVIDEGAIVDRPFLLSPFRPNYILPLSYNRTPNNEPYQPHLDELDSAEIKFQLSLKVPVYGGLINGHGDLYAAYTNTSWWQAFNKDISAPFRETNHEPELFLDFDTNFYIYGMKLRSVLVGISHQSNGRSGTFSRSWNRIYADFLLEKGNFSMSFKPWYRFKEDGKDKSDPNYPNVKGDDNPDLEKYMGNGELYFGYQLGSHNLGMMVRNNLRSSDNKGAVQLDWTFPVSEEFRGYIQYFNGYGESLIDYNANTNRLSVGIILSEWL